MELRAKSKVFTNYDSDYDTDYDHKRYAQVWAKGQVKARSAKSKV